MNTTSTSTDISVINNFIDPILRAIDAAQKETAQLLWSFLMKFLSEHWLSMIGILFVVLIITFVIALFGRWAMFGSVLYHYLYFGILFILGLIFGPVIFANVFIDLLLFILYLVCFALVGNILSGFGFRRR
jgi:hypothetical protein